MPTSQPKHEEQRGYANPASVALHEFLRVAGESVFSLNTIVVGLTAVESGKATKPESLHISWGPKDLVAAARKARKAAIHAQMVEVVEAINQYIQTVAKLPPYVHIRERWRHTEPSMAERLTELAQFVLDTHRTSQPDDECKRENAYLIAGTTLLVHWRNRHVHSSSAACLKPHEQKALRDNEDRIAARYSALSVDRLLLDFANGKPSLKDVSSLIAMTVRLIRRLDRCLYKCNSWSDVQGWLTAYGLDAELDKVIRESSAGRKSASIRQFLRSRAPQLETLYFEFREFAEETRVSGELRISD